MLLFKPEAEWAPPRLDDLPTWAGAKRVGIDIETNDPDLTKMGPGVRRDGQMVGVSFSIEDGPKAYLPFGHAGGDNLPREQVIRYLRDQAKVFKGDIVGANLSYDLDYLWEDEIQFDGATFHRDVQVADPILHELHKAYSLDAIAKRWDLPGKDETKLKEAAAIYRIHPKKELWKLPARFVGAYAEQDADLPLRVYRRQEREIDDANLWPIFNLESRVLPVLLRMTRRGVLVDQDRLVSIERWAEAEEAQALADVRAMTGVRINVGDVWKSDALAPALEAIGLTLNTTTQGKAQIDRDLLTGVDHDVARRLAWSRKVNKLRTTFAASVWRFLTPVGRIHTNFRQIAMSTDAGDMKGARYGRLSSTYPNLQQQPARDDFAARWRSIYVPEPGLQWASADYSQQEPRWATHFAATMNLQGAAKAANEYHTNPALDNHSFMADLTGLKRKFAKAIFLGLCYGVGGAKLCRDLHLPTRWCCAYGKWEDRGHDYFETEEEARDRRTDLGEGFVYEAAGEEGQNIIDTFDNRAPYIRKLARAAKKRAEQRGFIMTIGGRRLHFPKKPDGRFDWLHKALNRVIQGSSADQMKAALVELDENGHYLQLQVHDEVAASVTGAEEGEQIAKVMREVYPARVPFRVDVELGPSWGESMS